LVLFRAGP